MKTKQDWTEVWLGVVRRWIVHDWEAKVVSLVLACLVWYMVKEMVSRDRKIEMPKGWTPPMLPRIDARGDVR